MQTIYEDGQCLKNYLMTTLNEKNPSDFDENFMKNDDENSGKG